MLNSLKIGFQSILIDLNSKNNFNNEQPLACRKITEFLFKLQHIEQKTAQRKKNTHTAATNKHLNVCVNVRSRLTIQFDDQHMFYRITMAFIASGYQHSRTVIE